ncbi:hypothetical protein FJ872_27385 [Mesorhizobium sp. B2-5-9]|uniref:hypothetical protein n=1 Tax=Mesorhizobium sp. B2-5-9 TaxID=2589921 RepID=UPI00112E2EDA|nr:hypothetical protein [Mesorhizobium sp. B2-5-9]TPK04586.1 hypothetical protein FJ872_27385 [Mesorhizobium sp. B2-5-9]
MYVDQDASATFDPVLAYIATHNVNVTETTDKFTPAARWQKMVDQRWAEVLVPSTAVSSKREMPPAADAAWFSQTLARLSEIRKAGKNSEEAGLFKCQLEAVEYLIAHFAAWPMNRRPDLTRDENGAPHFSAKSQDYYLHLSIEDGAALNWYALLNGEEISQDEDISYRSSLSEKLSSLSRK